MSNIESERLYKLNTICGLYHGWCTFRLEAFNATVLNINILNVASSFYYYHIKCIRYQEDEDASFFQVINQPQLFCSFKIVN